MVENPTVKYFSEQVHLSLIVVALLLLPLCMANKREGHGIVTEISTE